MSDPALITLLSVVLSALITSTGTVIAAYISKDRKAEPQKEKVIRPDGYIPHGVKPRWDFRKTSIFLIAMVVIAVFARILLSNGLTDWNRNNSTLISIPTSVQTPDPCGSLVSRVYKGMKVQSANLLSKNLNVRKLPSISAPIITSVQNGTEFQILNGPICADGLMWWEASTTTGNTKGWIAEVNSNGIYYIEPK